MQDIIHLLLKDLLLPQAFSTLSYTKVFIHAEVGIKQVVLERRQYAPENMRY